MNYIEEANRLTGPTADDAELGRKLREDRKLERQRTCEHLHALPPTRWDPHSMCIDCGKQL
jgi:hypothetical protein